MANSNPSHAGRFKTGNVVGLGNQNARRGRFLTQALVAELNETDPVTGQKKFRALVKRLVDHAISKDGDLAAIGMIFDRVEGKAVQAVELSGRDGRPMETITSETSLRDAVRIYTDRVRSGDDYLPDVDEDMTDAERAEHGYPPRGGEH
jgi:hypothetical protein